jgi:hypothetical protein
LASGDSHARLHRLPNPQSQIINLKGGEDFVARANP